MNVRIGLFDSLALYAGIFYYLLGNLRPALRSSLKVIQLVTLVRHSLIRDYGIDKILEPFMASIKVLESVSFQYNIDSILCIIKLKEMTIFVL